MSQEEGNKGKNHENRSRKKTETRREFVKKITAKGVKMTKQGLVVLRKETRTSRMKSKKI